jgi:RND family efflux transporter MFP subunit
MEHSMPLHFSDKSPRVCKFFTLPSILIILIALVSTACSEPPQQAIEVIKPVKIYTVGGEGAITLEYPGQVSASTKADMAFEVSGKIVKFPVIAGQNVKKGELLAQLDLRDFQSTFNSAKGEFETAAANFSRAEKLIEDNFISKLDFDKLRSQRSTAKGKFDKAKKSLEDASLRAPFAGQVAMKLVEDFANITAKEPVLILQDVGQLELVVNVPEADWARSKKSDDLTAATKRLTPRVSIAGLPGSNYPAIIKEISTTADPTTRTYEAKLSFTPNSEVNVLPGMTATLTLTILQQDTGVSIPSKAVVSDNNKQAFVWRIDPDTMMATRTPVKLGNLTGINVIISEGLSSGDLIAVSGVHMLRDNMTVRRFQ